MTAPLTRPTDAGTSRCGVPGCGGELVSRSTDIGHAPLHCVRCAERLTKVSLYESALRGNLDRIEAIVTDVRARLRLVAQLNTVTDERTALQWKVRDLQQEIERLNQRIAKLTVKPVVRPGLSLVEQVKALLPRTQGEALSLAAIAERCAPAPNLSTLRRCVIDPMVERGEVARATREQTERCGPKEIYVHWLVEDGRSA